MHFDPDLEKRIAYLTNLENEKTKALLHVPEGYLRGVPHGKGENFQYYHRMPGDRSSGKYIRKSEMSLAQALAQKDYDQKVKDACTREISLMLPYANMQQNKNILRAEEIYASLPEWKQRLVKPFEIPTERLVKEFESLQYEGLPFADDDTTEYYTMKGERVRSKSEENIANQLFLSNVPYHYEKPLKLKIIGTVYPDLTILNVPQRKLVIWEHFGIMDDPDYAIRSFLKIYSYEASGYHLGDNFIFTCESKMHPLSSLLVTDRIKKFLLS